MEKYHGYESWLKKKYRTWTTYLSFMRQIEADLGGLNLDVITSIPYLRKLFIELQGRNKFMSRGASDRSNILSGFRTYIKYVEEKKEFEK